MVSVDFRKSSSYIDFVLLFSALYGAEAHVLGPTLSGANAWLSPLLSGVTDISVIQLVARQVTSFCWDLSWAWPTLASRCSPWPSTQSSGDGAPLPLPFSSRPQGLFHGSVSLGLSSLLLQRESIVPVKPSSLLLAPPPLHSVSSPPVCVSHRSGGPLCQASAFLYQLCLLVLSLWVSPLVGHHGSHAPGILELGVAGRLSGTVSPFRADQGRRTELSLCGDGKLSVDP